MLDPTSGGLAELTRGPAKPPPSEDQVVEDAAVLLRLIEERHFGVAEGNVSAGGLGEVVEAWIGEVMAGDVSLGEAMEGLQVNLRRELRDEHVRVGVPAEMPALEDAPVEEFEVGNVLVISLRRLFGSTDDHAKLRRWVGDADRHFRSERIIVDLRGNSGGDDGYVFHWVQRRIRESVNFARSRIWTVQGSPLAAWNLAAWTQAVDGEESAAPNLLAARHSPCPGDVLEVLAETDELEQGDLLWQGRMLVLVDRETRSSGESSAWLLRCGLGATLAGERTRGMIEYGNVAPYVLPHTGSVVWLCTSHNDFGIPVEGRGFPVDMALDSSIPIHEIAENFDAIIG